MWQTEILNAYCTRDEMVLDQLVDCMCGIVFKSSHSKFHKYENKYDFMQNC